MGGGSWFCERDQTRRLEEEAKSKSLDEILQKSRGTYGIKSISFSNLGMEGVGKMKFKIREVDADMTCILLSFGDHSYAKDLRVPIASGGSVKHATLAYVT